MVRKKTSSELEQAEIKLQSLMEKRDALNAEAQQARQERDLVHEKKREVGARLRPLKHRRASCAAEEQHESALAMSAKARAAHEETMGLSREIAALDLEGNEKHEAYLAARGKADEVHAKVVEMREKVLSIKGAARAEAREARDLLRQQNRSVRAALLDEKKLEASADAALRALMEKGKVEIGR